MRLLIYLLALFGGFSAAEASCQLVDKSRAAVALATIALAQTASEQSAKFQRPRVDTRTMWFDTAFKGQYRASLLALPVRSPVIRMDLQRE